MAKPWSIPGLDPSAPVSRCAAKILDIRIAEMYSYEPAALETENVDPVHDMRVSGRRLQSLYAIFRPLLPKKAYKRNMSELKMLLKDLGKVRDSDVLLESLHQKIRALPPKEHRSLMLLAAQEEAQRLKARTLLRRKLLALRRGRFEARLKSLSPHHR